MTGTGYVRYDLRVKLTRNSRNANGILTPYVEWWQLGRTHWTMIEAPDAAKLAADAMAGYSKLFTSADYVVVGDETA